MEKEQIRKVNDMFYQVTENFNIEEIQNLVDKLNTYLNIQKQQL